MSQTTIYKCNRCSREVKESLFRVDGMVCNQHTHVLHLCGKCRFDFLDWVKTGLDGCPTCNRPFETKSPM